MSKVLSTVALLTLLASATQADPAAPRIVVAISVDQFSADLFAEYRPLFAAGLKRLESGAVFPAGYQSHAATETCPGHSTILTGSRPGRTGIIANEWYDQSLARADKKVYCTENPAAPNSSSSNYTVSATLLNAQTLGDRLKAANPTSRVVSVAGKDRAAVMMGGHAIDQAWFWSGKSFVTFVEATTPAPTIIGKINAEIQSYVAKPQAAAMPPACRTRSVAVAVGNAEVGVPESLKAGNWSGFRTTLNFDRAVTDIAVNLIRDMQLGAGAAPDVLTVGLSATDYVGHAFGTEGAEMCAQVLSVDTNVGRILDALDATHQPYVVVLTADHGGHDVPERNRLRGFADAVRVDPALLPNAMSKQLASEFGLKEPVIMGVQPMGDIYLSRDIAAPLRARVLEATRAHYLAHSQVAAVFTGAEMRRMPTPTGPPDEWSLAERFRASYDPDRSGDLLVALKPHVTPITEPRQYIATHGSPWNYDRRVPILFYRPGMLGFEQPLPIETVDILPSLAPLIGLTIPSSEIDGRCIDLDPGPADTCERSVAQ